MNELKDSEGPVPAKKVDHGTCFTVPNLVLKADDQQPVSAATTSVPRPDGNLPQRDRQNVPPDHPKLQDEWTLGIDTEGQPRYVRIFATQPQHGHNMSPVTLTSLPVIERITTHSARQAGTFQLRQGEDPSHRAAHNRSALSAAAGFVSSSSGNRPKAQRAARG